MLRIIADDFGLHESVNNGIIFLLKNDKINGVALMANGEAFDHAVKLITTDLKPRITTDAEPRITTDAEPRITTDAEPRITTDAELNIGIHLVLVEEKSLTGIDLPKDYKDFFIKYILGHIKISDIEREMRAQLGRIANVGLKPSFINSHQHLHLLPSIMNTVIRLAKEYEISYIRVVNEESMFFKANLFRQVQLLFLILLSKFAKKRIKKAGLKCNDYFVGFINAGNLEKRDVEQAKILAEQYPDKIIELGCHPGYENEELRKKFKHWGDYKWEKELEIINEL